MMKRLTLFLLLLVLFSSCGHGHAVVAVPDEPVEIYIAPQIPRNEIEIEEENVKGVGDYEVEEVSYIKPEPIFTAEPLPEHIIDFITGVTFHETTPFGHDALAYLTITHADFDNKSRQGHMIVAAEIAEEVLDIFREIYAARFPIHQMRLIDYFGADDIASMEANNSHAFNFRYIAGTTTVSRHGFGMAVDINPIQNPYLRGNNLQPAAGEPYLDRDNVRPGMIVPDCPVYTAFTSRGWTWGGNWTSPRDYHHFEKRNP